MLNGETNTGEKHRGDCKMKSRFLAAIGFLTKIPVPERFQMDQDSLAESSRYFPIVGLVASLGLAGFDYLATRFFPLRVACVLDIFFLFVITGGMHLDGLIDTADGLLGGRTREDALSIMRDSRIGAMGAITVVLLILSKYALLVSLPVNDRVPALILAPVLGRWAMLLGVACFPYARQERGMGTVFVCSRNGQESVSPLKRLCVPAVLTILPVVGVARSRGVCALIICSFVSLACSRKISGYLGGLTGDVYGFLSEICEALALVVFCVNA